ncbi:hypothetical protein ACVILK_003284 [Bradyrhizobium embrapense]
MATLIRTISAHLTPSAATTPCAGSRDRRTPSEKVENHAAAIALHTMHDNFVRSHHTVKVTPAMATGVTDKL